MTVEKVLADYKEGVITKGELFVVLGELITADNVEQIVTQIPPELCEDFRQWVQLSLEGGNVVLGSNMSQSEARRITHRLAESIPVIKAWFNSRSHERDPANGESQAIERLARKEL